jgi:hypothetical protein
VDGECVTIGSACDDSFDCPSGQTCNTTTGTCEGSAEITIQWSWSIEAHTYAELGADDFDWICSWSNYGYPAEQATIRLLVDTDHDATEDYYYDAECQWGSATTDPATDPADYSAGDEIWVAWQFIGYDGDVWAQSPSWDPFTLAAGANDVGNVDFDWGDFGPLYVLVEWGDKLVDPAYGDCDFPPSAVAIMGYLLQYSTGEVADEVDIDTDPITCTSELFWLETEFDDYDLIIDGEDAAGTTVWGSDCTGLSVDNEDANDWNCEILMTTSP